MTNKPTLKIYKDRDADLKHLRGIPIAIIGYGSQGRAQALNLRDSGLQIIIGLPKKSNSIKTARKDGFEVYPSDEAVKLGEIISVLAPDHQHKKIYNEHMKKNLSAGKTLLFACGFSIHFRLVLPPKDVDVIMVAPHAPGEMMRKFFLEKKGVPCFFAVQQNYSGKGKKKALAYAKAIGCTKAGAIQTTFRDEAIGDLFGEQAVLCGGLTELLKVGFEVLVESGLSPENAYLECVHQLDFIVDTIKSHGIAGMFDRISKTAEYGSYQAGKRVIDDRVRKEMEKILKEIEDGSFVKTWMKECETGMKNYLKMKRMTSKHPIERTSKRIRDLMK
ncbi:MAG: ketol-acid reductoisomerase [candidate division Zixibacteria bacterium SM1_73]|nr:MAG: ketol-acid reductoisomerase [candidate division Zixibacteria bacterium SM1_73]